ncbi:hypothetical protein L484_026636 [Morus notabilis]|uniref:Pentatricopeptide repeat-containing protein n=1 Tax=Morus notabilis TaxID=981085 RepID=W9SCL8_9ROSA|nr:pentatricopeptide repeat-containing protein At3g51320 [Morus notabilis]EXC35313.1 hypothetical protein L484_026636 [Morus notabilis]
MATRICFPKLLFRFKNPSFLSPHSHPPKPTFPSHPFSSSSSSSRPCPWFPLLDASQTLIQVRQVHANMLTSGIFTSFWARKFLKFYSDFGHVDYTILIFRYIDFPGAFCVNTVLRAYSVGFDSNQALIFYFESLRNGFSPNSYTFVTVLGCCAKLGSLESGEMCRGQAIKNGVDSALQIQNSLIHMYGCCGNVGLARKVLDEMSERDLVSWNSLLDVYVRVGRVDVAHRMFDKMPERNVASWNIIARGYLNGGVPGCVLKLVREMGKLGLRGDGTTVVNAITACARASRLKEGRSVHGSLIRTGLESSVFIDTALIDMYSKCHRVGVACTVFDNMVEKNLVSWNAMILGHCIHGDPLAGIRLYNEMVGIKSSKNEESDNCEILRPNEDGGGKLRPDEVTFIGVLCACARARLLPEGKDYFREMTNVFGIKPNFAHYWCMSNIFASVGLIQEAEETIRNIPENLVDVSSDSFIWADLLSSSRFQGDVSPAEDIAVSLIKIEPQKLSYYRLLLNVYASAGRWEDVARVKEMVKEKVVGRMPGCNLVDLNEIVHNLKVGNHWQEPNIALADLAQKLRSSG